LGAKRTVGPSGIQGGNEMTGEGEKKRKKRRGDSIGAKREHNQGVCPGQKGSISQLRGPMEKGKKRDKKGERSHSWQIEKGGHLQRS